MLRINSKDAKLEFKYHKSLRIGLANPHESFFVVLTNPANDAEGGKEMTLVSPLIVEVTNEKQYKPILEKLQENVTWAKRVLRMRRHDSHSNNNNNNPNLLLESEDFVNFINSSTHTLEDELAAINLNNILGEEEEENPNNDDNKLDFLNDL